MSSEFAPERQKCCFSSDFWAECQGRRSPVVYIAPTLLGVPLHPSFEDPREKTLSFCPPKLDFSVVIG